MDLQRAIEERLEKRGAPFSREMDSVLREALYIGPAARHAGDGVSVEPKFKKRVLHCPSSNIVIGGTMMEKAAEELALATEELHKGKKELEATLNDVTILHKKIQSQLEAEIRSMRETRFAVSRESADTLHALRELRKFFLEGEYAEEMRRLERFLGMARELKTVLDDGTLQAAADIMLRLAVKEPS